MTQGFRYRLTAEDYAALINAFGLRRFLGQVQPWMWYTLGALNVLMLLAMIVLGLDSGPLRIMSVTLAIIAFTAPTFNRIVIRSEFNRQGLGHEDVVLSLNETGLVTEQGGIKAEVGYRAITKVDERRDHILLWVNRRQAVIVPKRALGAVSAAQFVDQVERGRDRAV